MHLTTDQLFFTLPSPSFSRPAAALVPLPARAVISSFLCICSLPLLQFCTLSTFPFHTPLSNQSATALHITAGELYKVFCRSAAQQQSGTLLGCIWTEVETTVQMLMPQSESPCSKQHYQRWLQTISTPHPYGAAHRAAGVAAILNSINTVYSSSNRTKSIQGILWPYCPLFRSIENYSFPQSAYSEQLTETGMPSSGRHWLEMDFCWFHETHCSHALPVCSDVWPLNAESTARKELVFTQNYS